MGEQMRAFDWSATTVGVPASWSPALRTLVELLLSSKQPMFLAWGPEQIWFYNDAFIPIAGSKHPVALGRPSRDVWSEMWTDLEPMFEQVFKGEPVYVTGFTAGLDRRGTVEEAYFDFSYTPIRGEGAVVQGLFGVSVETTERVLSARRQRTAAERERNQLFELTRDLFGVATFDGHLHYINPAWSRVLGRSHEELIATPFAQLIHPDDLATTADVLSRLRSGEAGHQFHVRLLRADGSAVSFAWSAVPGALPDSGIFYTVGRDITDDLRREEALRQSQKMEAVGQLTGGLAHDFNNLLQAVHGNLDLIRRKSHDPERVARLAGNGLQAAERGAKLTAQLLAFSRSQKLELRAVSVAPLIAGMDDLLQRSLGPLIRVTVDAGRSDLSVMADPTQLEMALLNLAINARDAMAEGGELSITVDERAITNDPELPPGRYVEIRVADTGTGMPAAIAARAFDPFFTTKGVGEGTGLGLSQVYGMAKQAGGTARIESRAPRGTTVALLLKFVEAASQPAATIQAAELAADGFAKTVLVVDDDPDVRQFLCDSLDALGYDVVAVEDGPRGLLALASATPDLVLLDFAMPGMNGAEVAKRMLVKHPDLPVIFVSGYSDTAAIEAAIGKSAVVLKKPFAVTDLEAALRTALLPEANQNQ